MVKYVTEIWLKSRSVVWKNDGRRSFSSARRAVWFPMILFRSNRSRECAKCNHDIFRNRSVGVNETPSSPACLSSSVGVKLQSSVCRSIGWSASAFAFYSAAQRSLVPPTYVCESIFVFGRTRQLGKPRTSRARRRRRVRVWCKCIYLFIGKRPGKHNPIILCTIIIYYLTILV